MGFLAEQFSAWPYKAAIVIIGFLFIGMLCGLAATITGIPN